MKNYVLKTLTLTITFVLVSLFLTGNIFAQTQTFSNPALNGLAGNTFNIPTGVTKVTVECWGGGGAGGGCTNNNNNAGGGGGGGTFTLAGNVAVSLPVNITVGAGGLGVSGGNGNPGQTSIFNSTGPVSAVGGTFGSAGVGTSGTGVGGNFTIGLTYDGGAGSNGVNSSSGTSFGGAGGGGAGNGGDGGNALLFTGGAGGLGTLFFGIPGGTGAAGQLLCANGINAGGLAAGGGGAHNTNNGGACTTQLRTGGNGGNGQVVVRYIVITPGSIDACYTTSGMAIAAALAATTVSDDCVGDITKTASISGGPCNATITVTATNGCGSESQTTYTTNINPPPVVFTCGSDVTVTACSDDETVSESWSDFLASTTASGGCNGVLTNDAPEDPPSSCGASVAVTWTYTSSCEDDFTCTRTFTVETSIPPEIVTLASDYTAECDGSGNQAELDAWLEDNGGAVAESNCDFSWSNDFESLSDDCGATGSATVTFAVSDDCGNTSYTTATFTIEDTTNPTIDDEASDMTVECDGAGNVAELEAWLDDNGGAEASDVCSGVTWDNDFTALSDDCGATGSATVTFSATDDCGNTSYTTATFTIEDTTNPLIDVEASDMTVECDGAGNVAELEAWLADNGGAEASDICSGVTWDNDFTALSDDCGATGSATVTFSATDDCGNTSYTTATFTIEDTTNPSIDVEASDMTVECDGAGNVAELEAWLADNGGAEASDICSGVTWDNDFTALSDDCGATGSATVTFSATDDCGNTSYTTATFTIEDTTNPSIDVEASDMTVECDGAGNVAELEAWLADNGGAEASDICSGVTWDNDFTALSDDCGATGSATVTFSATDDCGNTSYSTATFTIEDTTNPSIDVEASDQTVECDGAGNLAELEAWLADNGGAEASDVCSGVTWDNDFTALSDDCGATGSATVTFSATDDCGNTSYTTATFTIEDTTNPSIDVEASDMTVECDGAGNLAELEAWLANNGGAEASDVCSGVTWDNDFTALSDDCGATGSATVTFSATDDCGNTSYTTATFTIEDTTNPSIDTEASGSTVECDGADNVADLEAWLDNNGGASASDACSEVTWGNDFTELSDDCGATGSATVTFSATDDCGNTSYTTATFTIVDTTVPSMDTEASGQTVECDGSGNEADLQAWLDNNGGASASDACSEVTWGNDFTELGDDCGATGSATVTFSATDDCGNTSYTTATFTIVDTTVPSMDTEASGQTVECDGSGNEADLQAWLDNNGGASASDACGEVTWGNDFSELNDDCGATGSATVTFSATDDCGNTSYTTATFTIEDNTPPVALCHDVVIDLDDIGNISIGPDDIDNGSYDECGEVTLSVSPDNLECPIGAIVTLTVTDECGNTATCTATVTVDIPELVSCGNNNDKVLICHIPPGHPENLHTICIDVTSLCDHLAHGDYIGACGEAIALPQDPGNDSKVNDQIEVSNDHVEKVSISEPNVTVSKTTKSVNHFIYSQPNPFDNQTTIHVGLDVKENVSLRVFNNMGQLVTTLVEGTLEAGEYSFVFDASNLSDGLYFYSLTTGKVVESGRLILAR